MLANFIYRIANNDQLAYLSLIDLIFPGLGLYGCWKYSLNDRDPKTSSNACSTANLLVVVRTRARTKQIEREVIWKVNAGWPAACTCCLQYAAWCILWTLAGTVILLIRVGVIQVNIGGTAALFFGGPSSGTFIYTASIVLTAVQLALMVRRRPRAFQMRARNGRPLAQTWLPALPSFLSGQVAGVVAGIMLRKRLRDSEDNLGTLAPMDVQIRAGWPATEALNRKR